MVSKPRIFIGNVDIHYDRWILSFSSISAYDLHPFFTCPYCTVLPLYDPNIGPVQQTYLVIVTLGVRRSINLEMNYRETSYKMFFMTKYYMKMISL